MSDPNYPDAMSTATVARARMARTQRWLAFGIKLMIVVAAAIVADALEHYAVDMGVPRWIVSAIYLSMGAAVVVVCIAEVHATRKRRQEADADR